MLNIDRYHATMGDASYKDVTRLHETLLSEAEATFYAAQRKLPYAPCLGHERLIRSFLDLRIDRPRLRTLEQAALARVVRGAVAVCEPAQASRLPPPEPFTDSLDGR